MALLRQQTVQLGARGTCRAPLSPGPPLERGCAQVPRSLCRRGRGGRSGVQSFAALSWQQVSVAASGCSLPPAGSALNPPEGCGRSCELKAGEHEGGAAPQSGLGDRDGGRTGLPQPPQTSVALESSPGQQEDTLLLAWAEDGARMAWGPSQAGGDR